MEAELVEAPEARRAFQGAIEAKSGGRAYQAGADALIGLRGQDALNRTVRSMILSNAHRPTINRLGNQEEVDFLDDAYCDLAEREVSDWLLSPAVEAFGRLLVDDAGPRPPLVMTTNFDPLIQLAVRKAGGVAVTEVFDADGRIGGVDAGDAVVVAHLHGFWRRDDTAHVPQQLLRDRPDLQGSLEDLLQERTMIVSGYGGWDDIFTTALIEAVRRHRAGDLNVLWTFRSEDTEELERRHKELLNSVEYVPGRVTFYKGTDCESLFGLMADVVDVGPAAAGNEEDHNWFQSPIEGFTAVTEDFLSGQPDPSSADLVRFFDGRVPTWQASLAASIPRLSSAKEAIDEVMVRLDQRELAVALMEGPSGEGKSTALRQVAAHFGTSEGWRVLWREAGLEAAIDVSVLEEGAWRWLVLVDDADVVAAECLQAVRALREGNRTDVQFVLASRTSDWRSRGATNEPWSAHASFSRIGVEGLSEKDARAIVESWEAAGEDGLGRLLAEDSPEARASALLAAAKEAVGEEGSFFGAMLKVRFGPGLRDHVRTLGARLDEVKLESGLSLLDAFLYVACLHAHGVSSLPPEALSSALGIPRAQTHRLVIWPLGDEAVLTGSGSSVCIRHRSIAEVAVELAGEWGEDLGEIYHAIIAATVRVYRTGIYIPNLADIVYLPGDLPASIALKAARAPVEEEPERLNYRVTLAKVMRKAGHAEEGVESLYRAYGELHTMVDRYGSRALVYEWSVCAGVSGQTRLNAFLALLSISDNPAEEAGALEWQGFTMRLRGLVQSLNRLSQETDRPWLAEGLAAASEIEQSVEGGNPLGDRAQYEAAFEALGSGLLDLVNRDEADRIPQLNTPMTFRQVVRILARYPTA